MRKTNWHRSEFDQMDECLPSLFKQYPQSPYGMHYWYFNIVTPKTRENFTYILSNIATPTKLNGIRMPHGKNTYVNVLSDFRVEKISVEEKKVEVTNSALRTDNFLFEMIDGKVRVCLEDQEFVFDRLLTDSYIDHMGPFYEWSSVNFGNGTAYMNAESVMKRGPLIPWNWLHFFLEDGTYIKVFDLPFNKATPLRINDTQLSIVNIEYTPSTVSYAAKKNNDYLNIKIGLDKFKAHNEYAPFFSPSWIYDQYSPYLIKIETNLEGINVNQKGGGILELARGWSL